MPLDKIVVFLLALLFFGGLVYVYRKSRRDEKTGGQAPAPDMPIQTEDDLPKKPREKARRAAR